MGKMNKCACEDECCCECCCCDGGSSERGFTRRYQTKAEQITELEQYLKDLKSEVQAVEERLGDLKRKK